MIRRYGVYSTAMTLIFAGTFFLNERFFYGTVFHFRINVILCVLLGLQFLFFLYNGIRIIVKYKIRPLTFTGAGIILSLLFIILCGALIFGGGIRDTDTGTLGIKPLDLEISEDTVLTGEGTGQTEWFVKGTNR